MYNAVDESGWAVELVQRGGAIFAVLFVYDQSNNPVWYWATLHGDPLGPNGWTGAIYATKGPWFGAVPFNSSQVTLREVGTMIWTPTSGTGGVLTYSVDGIEVTKTIARVLIRYDYFGGNYGGGVHEEVRG